MLNQTFQDFELIIRDDGSTDGSADFVAERYAAEISSGKIKLRRNEENIGEFPTDNRLIREATGKYFMILHSDDVYLPHALEHMYTVAEQFQADVVHNQLRLTTKVDGVIEDGTDLKIEHNKQLSCTYTGTDADKTAPMSSDPAERFAKWVDDKINVDAPYCIFRREFMLNNDLLFWEGGFGLTGGNKFFTLKWLVTDGVFVKTTEPFYIRRDSPDSITRAKISPERIADVIAAQIEFSRHLEQYFASEKFFRDNEQRRYLARSSMFAITGNWWIKRNGVYKDGVTFELNRAVEDEFKKHFGKYYMLPTFLFNWAQALQAKKPILKIIAPLPNQ
ncbi:MAG: glycosyltransferase [Selenomonadaceae bacterium]|nr:glycosyltransferase [Selenomonadaceae bacterium]